MVDRFPKPVSFAFAAVDAAGIRDFVVYWCSNKMKYFKLLKAQWKLRTWWFWFWGFGALTKLLSLEIPAGVIWFITFGSSWIFTVLFNSLGVGVEDAVTLIVIFMFDCVSISLLIVSDMIESFHNKLLFMAQHVSFVKKVYITKRFTSKMFFTVCSRDNNSRETQQSLE